MCPTRQDLTQGLFYCGGFGEGEVEHEPRLVCCWSMLAIGSLGAMSTMLNFAKSPCTKPGYLAGHRFTRPEWQVQFESIQAFSKSPCTNSGDLTGHRFTRHECQVQCESMLAIVKSPCTKLGYLAGPRFTRPEYQVQCESMLAFAKSTCTKPGDLAGYSTMRIYACHCLAS